MSSLCEVATVASALNTPSLDWTSGSVKSAHEMATPLRVLAISLQRASFLSMILTYSLSNGLAIGILCYIVMRLFEGKAKEISIPVYVMGAIFLASFVISSL